MKEYDAWLETIARCQDEVERIIHKPKEVTMSGKGWYNIRVKGCFDTWISVGAKDKDDAQEKAYETFYEELDADMCGLEILDMEYAGGPEEEYIPEDNYDRR